MQRIKKGDLVRDRVTGYQGIVDDVMVRVRCLDLDEHGRPQDSTWHEQDFLDVVGAMCPPPGSPGRCGW